MLIFTRRIFTRHHTHPKPDPENPIFLPSSLKKFMVSLGCHGDALICFRISCPCASRIVSRTASQRVSLTLLLAAVLASCTLACGMACSTRCGSALVSWSWLLASRAWSSCLELLGAASSLLFEIEWIFNHSSSEEYESWRASCDFLVGSHSGDHAVPSASLLGLIWSLSFDTWDFRAPVGAEHNAARRPRVGCVVVTSEHIVDSFSFL